MKKYCIGVDYGTLSGRAVLIDVENGDMIADSVKEYTHGVMDKKLPTGEELGVDWALQHPNDYLEVLEETIPKLINNSGVSKENIIGMSIDFTACTILPVDKNGDPLCFNSKYKHNPHSYVKLWKHHSAQKYANRLNDVANEMGETWLSRYGGKISSEWLVPKVMQLVDEAEDVYNDTDCILEATDWVTFKLCGNLVRSTCTAGYKALWSKSEGYPKKSFFKSLDSRLENLVEEKLKGEIKAIGQKAGNLTAEMAEKLNLTTNVAVAVGNVDAHVAMPAVGGTKPGQMLMIMGTSTCDILLGSEEKRVPGMCGVVEDGVIPGLFGFEAGQSCVGDHFDWCVHHFMSQYAFEAAEKNNMNIHQYLTNEASKLEVGESGLLALDWWNGNRSVLVDVDLTGMILGMTLQTKPEEIYRALIEATAYGTRMIIDTFEESGVQINELFACGGISWKNKLMMQIYSDVTNRVIKISDCEQTPALGSAMFGAVAAGKENGGYDSIIDASVKMSKIKEDYYKPNPRNVKKYNELFSEYKILHDYFGRGENDVMKRIKNIKKEVKNK